MEEPAPQIDEDREGRLEKNPEGETERKRRKGTGTGRIVRLEKSGESPAQPSTERKSEGCGPHPEAGYCPAQRGGAIRRIRGRKLPERRVRRYGRSERIGGRSVLNRESESQPGWNVPECPVETRSNWWTAENSVPVQAGNGGSDPVWRRKPAVATRLRLPPV